MGTNIVISSKTIGEKVKFRRQDIGMSQERLAEILELSYQQIQRYENGRNKLNVERIQQIANALSVPVSYFFADGYSAPLPVPPPNCILSDEVRNLLRYFEKIPEKPQRQLVIGVARMAAKK